MVSGYPKSIGIPQVDWLSTRPPDFGASHFLFMIFVLFSYFLYLYVLNFYKSQNFKNINEK